MGNINRKPSGYGGAYDHLDHEPEDDNSLQTALSNSADNILKNETIMAFYKNSKERTKLTMVKQYFKMGLVTLGGFGIPILLFIESLDDYEWICLWENCGNYNKLSISKLWISIAFNICAILLKTEDIL